MKRLKASVAELYAVVSHKVTFAHVFSLSEKTDATIAILLTKSSVRLKMRAFWLKTSFILDKNCNTTIRFRRGIHQVCKTLENQCVKHEGPLNGWNLTVSSRFWILFRARGMPTIHLDSLNINYSSEADKQAGDSKSRNSSSMNWCRVRELCQSLYMVNYTTPFLCQRCLSIFKKYD